MRLELLIDGTSVLRRMAKSGMGDPLPLVNGETANAALRDWSERYSRAVQFRTDEALLEIGREMFAWLDQGGVLADWMLTDPRELVIQTSSQDSADLTDALLAAPWELLADQNGFLALDMRLFSVVRQAHGAVEPQMPDHKDIALLFMAASPRGQNSLDHEGEEAMILQATRPKLGQAAPVHLQVEESGSLEFLAEAARLEGPFEALHLSCHGNILSQENASPQPVIFLETDEGEADPVTVDRLKTKLGQMPPLLFLSACRTAERGEGRGRPLPEGFRRDVISDSTVRRDTDSPDSEASPDLADPFARQISGFTANVLGWDGSVYDSEAALFAETFYQEVSKGDTAPIAAAKARRTLLRERSPENAMIGAHWHLARVYLGPGGGGPICDPRAAAARPARPDTEQAFLGGDRRVPVASRDRFVGRRREIQRIIAAFRSGTKGVVIHGMGNLGKSSLAARVASRTTGYRVAVVYGICTARTIFEALRKVLNEIADDLEDYSEARTIREELVLWEEEIAQNPTVISDIFRRLLRGHLNTHPVLLVLDDFEQSLLPPSTDTAEITPRPDCRDAVLSLLQAVSEAQSASRLLVTSRFDFVAKDAGACRLDEILLRVPLVPMEGRERAKQVRAKATAEDKVELLSHRAALINEALEVSAGSPGLQDVLTGTILNDEEAAAQRAIEQIRNFQQSGETPPPGTDLGDFFARMTFEVYADALTGTQRRALGAAAIFSEDVPIPRPALLTAIGTSGIAEPEAALDRLLALGLVDDWGAISPWTDTLDLPHHAVNPLARSLEETLTEGDVSQISTPVLADLSAAWRDDEGDFPLDPRGLEAARLGLEASDPDPEILEAAAAAALKFLLDIREDAAAALTLGMAALERLEQMGHIPGPILPGKLVVAANRLGEVEIEEKLIEDTLQRGDLAPLDRGQFLAMRGAREDTRGSTIQAMNTYEEAVGLLRKIGADHSVAVTREKFADILQNLGNLDMARRIYEKEALPVFEALSDRRQIAITRRKIAYIVQKQGDLDEARRIYEREALPVFEALGDRHEIATTYEQIAFVLRQQGDLDEARRIYEREALPVFEALGDRHLIARTRGHIADILCAQGEFTEARRIYEQETLPVFEALGIRLESANTHVKIADILLEQGDLDGARRIFEKEALPVFEALDESQKIAITHGNIAYIMHEQGDLDEARRIYEKEALPIFEAIGNSLNVAHTHGHIAYILWQQGDLGEARRIYEQEVLPVFNDLDDRRAIVVTHGQIADILQEQGDLDGARRIYEQEVLPVFNDLDDRRAIVVTHGQIADILQEQGDLDGALDLHLSRLPDAEHMQDISIIAAIHYNCAHIRLLRGDLKRGELPVITNELRRSFAITQELSNSDGVGQVGALLAQVLAFDDLTVEALEVLDQAEQAYDSLGSRSGIDHCQTVRDMITEKDDQT
ncbi:tetratricopeptide repeat protein [Aliiroseovarius sp. M344]|uniref:tetratricopeptide repeat protein n=1 Tax=Aliiroseovarius sp. M344 TaxID=2867010 RepID=UPI0021AD633F|nr:tetratricopeptide repeat protein [Aliiroseovarius sp. M344]UWQ13085.1 tetratricopeptide repeat protein [Aliiroseovarius sp. M344]